MVTLKYHVNHEWVQCELPLPAKTKKTRVSHITVFFPKDMTNPDTKPVFLVTIHGYLKGCIGPVADSDFDPEIGTLDWSLGHPGSMWKTVSVPKMQGYELTGKVVAGAVRLWARLMTGEIEQKTDWELSFEDDAFPVTTHMREE